MPCSKNFSVTFQTEILSTVTSDFLKQIIPLKSFYSMLISVQGKESRSDYSVQGLHDLSNALTRHSFKRVFTIVVVVVVLLFYIHSEHLRSCRGGTLFLGRLRPPKRLTSTSCT